MATFDELMSPLASMLANKQPTLDEVVTAELSDLQGKNLLAIEKKVAEVLSSHTSTANAELVLLLRQIAGTYK